ncbi:MAG: acyl transferase [Bacteroidota bacterium]
MSERNQLAERILNIENHTFEDIALEVFYFQYHNNRVYQQFCNLLGINPGKINASNQIPFLPIGLFKSHIIITNSWKPQIVFQSSGTTGSQTSRHYVRDLDFYGAISLKGFQTAYSKITDYCFLALLPSYLEREGSSLVYMVNHFMNVSGQPANGFYLDDLEALAQHLEKQQKSGFKTILLGVTFALLDFAATFKLTFPELIIMETGGMKGRRKEITRFEVHEALVENFAVSSIHSEYGMTELMSQAYSSGNGIFSPSPTMKVVPRDPMDPLSKTTFSRACCLNIIDLGNLDTCSFIATDDLGKVFVDGTFEVTGRLDKSDIRGCNLLLAGL